jgi:hypothetical protein
MGKRPWTDGPWKVKESFGDFYVTGEGDGKFGKVECNVAISSHCFPEGCIGLDEANARLIAQAPAMYEMLERLWEYYRHGEDRPEALFKLNGADELLTAANPERAK